MNSLSQNTSNREQVIREFLRDYANKPKDVHTVHEILSEAGEYYDADRSYIFELNSERTRISNTYEWCRDGVSAEKDRLESQDNLITALSMSYENVYAVNIAVCYRMDKTMKSRYGSRFAVGDYESNIRLYVENEVIPEDRNLFDKICSILEIRMIFSEKQAYSFSYRVIRRKSAAMSSCLRTTESA